MLDHYNHSHDFGYTKIKTKILYYFKMIILIRSEN